MTRKSFTITGQIVLIAILFAQLLLSIRQESQTFDEACHLFAGYSYWKNSDFGFNPEHPPLVKLLSALPLLRLHLNVPHYTEDNFKVMEYAAAQSFLYSNNADMVLYRARIAASVLTLCLCISVFRCTFEMFGRGPAWMALVLFVFEPNILAHGALVATDMGVACFLFVTVYAFYRYLKKPTLWRCGVVGITAGLTLGAKHSGILVFPILLLLTFLQLVWNGKDREAREQLPSEALRLAFSLMAISVIAAAILWSLYGFRFQARPHAAPIVPALSEYLQQVDRPVQSAAILHFQNWRVLPQAYLYGLADVIISSEQHFSYLLGKLYPGGRWFYFPADLVIKSTLPFLIFLVLVPLVFAKASREHRKEFVFLTIPPALYLLVALASGFNLGVRHILPIFPFLIVLAGVSAWDLAQRRRYCFYATTALLIFHVASSVWAFPNYLAYSNEIAGGPRNTYKVLADSNVDWGQGLKLTKHYLDQHHIRDCWFAYFAYAVADPAYYGIPCKPLPSAIATAIQVPTDIVPTKVNGAILVSVNEVSGIIWGPGELNPYAQFQRLHPVASIGDAILVFEGQFDIPIASAETHITTAMQLAQSNRLDEALIQARQAVVLAPKSVEIRFALASLLKQMKRMDEARQSFQEAMVLAKTVYPEYRKSWVIEVQQAMAEQ